MENNKKGTDRDVRPTRGQESNENWDDKNTERSGQDTEAGHKSDARNIDEATNTTGAASSQTNRGNDAIGGVGPLDSDMATLPSEKRASRSGNSTGPGLG